MRKDETRSPTQLRADTQVPRERVAAVADVFISGQEARKLDCTGARLCTHSALGPTAGPKDMSAGRRLGQEEEIKGALKCSCPRRRMKKAWLRLRQKLQGLHAPSSGRLSFCCAQTRIILLIHLLLPNVVPSELFDPTPGLGNGGEVCRDSWKALG